MHTKRLCFIFPAAIDDVGSKDEEKKLNFEQGKEGKGPLHHHQGCGAHVGKFIQRKLNKLVHSRWSRCGHRQENKGLFHDTEGVNLTEEEVGGGENPRIFSYSELYIGSNGFSSKQVLGSGGFGRVYRAVLPSDGTIVAVKCVAERGERFEKTFMAELVAVAHLRHRNLVKLRGWCVHDDELLLVYDYMPYGSLDKLLFPKKLAADKKFSLNWEARKKIIDGLAAALCYLHEQLEKQIIHRDVKASNVMLDIHMNARLGDFGLARWQDHDLQYHQPSPSTDSIKNLQFRLAETTRIGGTIGYLPPESFQKRSSVTAKSDVFSFGVVILEIVSGRRAVDLTCPDDQIILLDWIRRLSDEGMVLRAGDNRLVDGSYRLSEMERMFHLGLLCTLYDPKLRPNMKWTVDVLSGNIIGKLPNLPSFKSHPLYISLSSSGSDTSGGSYTFITKSVSSTSSKPGLETSNYVTAIGETVYVTAEKEDEGGSDIVSSSRGSYKNLNTFPIIETPRVISYKDIIAATDDFSDSRRVAELDFGTAYHGLLENKHHILVKRLGMKTCPALRVRFSNELLNLGRLRHRNLVQLRGWCTEQGEMLVVYDYLPNRFLSNLLFHNKKRILQWRYRYSIIKSLACAIRYLHDEWDEQVIHRNITASAVIIDSDMNPRLGSFALAEFLTRKEDGEHVVNIQKSVSGIFGYMSPEYMISGEATTMADVYSFGVVILEVVTGQMAVDFRRPEVLLVEKVHEFEERERSLEELADYRLDGMYNKAELLRLIRLGIACTRSSPESRPSMKQAVSILNGYDHWLVENAQQGEKREYWRDRNNCSLCIIRRIQSIGIN